MPEKKNIEELLRLYVEDSLDAAEKARIEELIRSDDDVRQLHGVIAALTHESKQDKDLRAAANALVARFVRDLKKNGASDDNRHGLLTFDSGLLPLPAGVRPATVDSRRLRYTAGEHQLEISMYPASPGTLEIIGQVSGYSSGTILDVRLEGERRKFTAESNQFQVFHFVRIPAGEYSLSITGPDKEVCTFILEV